MFRHTTPEQIDRALDALLTGAKLGAAAKAADVTRGTIAIWAYEGAPVATPSVPAGTPLLIAALRKKWNLPLDNTAVSAEQQFAERMALSRMMAIEVLRSTGDFLAAFGQGEEAK